MGESDPELKPGDWPDVFLTFDEIPGDLPGEIVDKMVATYGRK